MLKFNFSEDNYSECRRILKNREWLKRITLEFLGIIFAVMMTTIVLIANKDLSKWWYSVTIIVWIIFSIICDYKFNLEFTKDLNKKIKKYRKQNMFGESNLEFSQEGIILKLNRNKRVYPWKIVRSIKFIKGNLYIFIGSSDYVSIPREAFKAIEETEVIKQINSYRNNFLKELINL